MGDGTASGVSTRKWISASKFSGPLTNSKREGGRHNRSRRGVVGQKTLGGAISRSPCVAERRLEDGASHVGFGRRLGSRRSQGHTFCRGWTPKSAVILEREGKNTQHPTP